MLCFACKGQGVRKGGRAVGVRGGRGRRKVLERVRADVESGCVVNCQVCAGLAHHT
jgi:hypothetical protein